MNQPSMSLQSSAGTDIKERINKIFENCDWCSEGNI
jgi:hypothetical protein